MITIILAIINIITFFLLASLWIAHCRLYEDIRKLRMKQPKIDDNKILQEYFQDHFQQYFQKYFQTEVLSELLSLFEEDHTDEDHTDEDHTDEDHTAEDHTAEDHTAEDHTAEDHTAEDHTEEDHTAETPIEAEEDDYEIIRKKNN